MSMRFGFRSITGKLVAAFLLVFLLLVVFQLVTQNEYSENLKKLKRESAISHVKAANTALMSVFDSAVINLNITLGIIRNTDDPAKVEHALKLLVNENPNYVAAGMMDEKGHSIHRFPELPPGEKPATLPPAILRSVPSVSSISYFSGQSVFVTSIPVHKADNHLNILYVVVSTNAVTHLLQELTCESSSIIALDREGETVSQVGSDINPKDVNRILLKQKLIEGQFRQFDGPNIHCCGTVSSRSGWRIAAIERAHPEGIAIAGTNISLLWPMLMVSAFMIFFIIGNRIASPIRKLSRAAAAVAVGDLRRRIAIDTRDELQSLADNFNKMTDSLEAQQKTLHLTMRIQRSLLDVTKTVTSSLDIDSVASSIEDVLQRQFGAEYVIIYRSCSVSDALEPLIFPAGESDAFREAMYQLAQRTIYSPGDTSDPSALAYSCAEAGGKPAVTVPLIIDNHPVGVLITTFPDDECSKMQLEDQISFLEAFSSCAAIAVHNACTHRKTEELMGMLDSLKQVDEAISASLDLRQVLGSLARITKEVMKAKACAILLTNDDGVLSVAEAHNISREFRNRLDSDLATPSRSVDFLENCFSTTTKINAGYISRCIGRFAREQGFNRCICVRLTTGNSVIGAITVWHEQSGKVEQKEMDLLIAIASHAAVVIANAKLFSREYRIAETLQSTLIGTIPDRLGGLTLGNKYLSALDEARVGGDLFDAVALPNGKVALMIADVSGKGIQAAMHTAMIRYMARAFIFQWPDSPATALNMLNRAIINYFENMAIVTVFCAIIDPKTGLLVYANAGHPPAIAITHSSKQQIMLYRTGIPIGYADDFEYEERTVNLSPGDLLLLYTDGIIEARQAGGDVLSVEGLQEILFRHTNLGPQEMVEVVCEETKRFAEGNFRDDIAIIAAAIEPKPKVLQLQWEADHQKSIH